jgi:hypothetical protein
MRLTLSALALGLLLAPAAAPAATPPKAGTYEFTMLNPVGGTIYGLVKITPKDDGVEGEVVAGHPALRGLELKTAALDGETLRIVLNVQGTDLAFEGRVPQAGADTVLGTLEINGRLSPARLKATDKTGLTPATVAVRSDVPEPMRKAQAVSAKPQMLRVRAARAQDAEEKAKLQKEAAEAAQEAKAELPKLYREVVEKHADSPAAALAAQDLIRQAGKNKVDAAEVGRWAALVQKDGAAYGPRYETEMATQLAEMLAPQKDYAPLALGYAQRAEKALTAKDSAEKQVRVLGVLADAQKKAGKAAEGEQTEARLAKLNAELDREYLAKVPPFKPETFAGRKGKTDRAVVMELFTGAECPPCVPADIAFDVLEKTYKPTELVLIQYHLHIPGPDPLTNAATEARAEYYDAHSTPSTFFNGQAKASGGGRGIDDSERKYKEYREVIDPLLEEPAKAAVAVGASRQGDKLSVQAEVTNLADPGEGKRLRLLVVEEAVRYAGGNKLRFHHMVVRAMPGGPEGVALAQKDTKHTASVDLAELRQELTKYLDDYAAEQRPFPRASRPMEFKHLKVIALVQDDKTKEILQAAAADVGGDRAAK